MNYQNLIQSKRIKTYQAEQIEIDRLIMVANRDIQAAQQNLKLNTDWAFTIAYNAVLQACRALMFANGFRSRGAEHHGTVIEFAKETLGSSYQEKIIFFDQIRRKRHRTIYEVAGIISETEAIQVVAFAAEFVKELESIIKRNN